MALEVINDLASEVHRNWVCTVVTRVLGARLPHGVWILRLQSLGGRRVSLTLTGPDGPVVPSLVATIGEGAGDLERALRAAVAGREPS
jgi:hypothetical protein